MVRKNYPFNERDEKKMINFISQILVYSVLAPLLLFGIKSFGNEDSDILENSILGVILLISSFISFLIVLPLLNISSFLVELLVHCIISFILTAVLNEHFLSKVKVHVASKSIDVPVLGIVSEL